MMLANKRADLLERSLQGHHSADQEIQDLVATARRVSVLASGAISPRDDFVSSLGLRLRAEALTLPASEARRVPPATVGRGPATRPMVFVIGRGLPRMLAGATASVLLVGAVVGGTSRSALPGSLLYPVKQLLNSAAVQLAGSDLDRGTTLLSQAQEHIGDAAALVDRDGAQADPASVNEALVGGYDATIGGQRNLLGEFDRTGDAQALTAIQDFTASALPALNALQPLVPAASKPDLDALIALVQDGRNSLARKVAACGPTCASMVGTALGGSPGSTPGAELPPTLVPTPSGLPTSGAVPTASVTGPGGVVGAPSGPRLLTTTTAPTAVSPPPLVVGPVAVSPAPIVIPPILKPLPLLTKVIKIVPTLATTLPTLPLPLPLPLPTTLLGLP